VQANVFTEHMRTDERMEKMAFPRLSPWPRTAGRRKPASWDDFAAACRPRWRG
jgi:N-acetyl-beta-hexosaminidase